MGSSLPYTVPRSSYRCADGRWVAVSTSAEPVGRRVMQLIGLGDDERFARSPGDPARDEVDPRMAAWWRRALSTEAVAAFDAAEAAAALVYDMADMFADPHFAERGVSSTSAACPSRGCSPVVAPRRAAGGLGRPRRGGRPPAVVARRCRLICS